MTEDFKEKFNNILIEKLVVEIKDIYPKAEFSKDLGADSLDMVELVMEFEQNFKITISDDDAAKIITVEDAEKYIMEKLESHG